VLSTLGHDFWGEDVTLSTSHKSYRPLTTQSFRFNSWVGGRTPQSFHLGNVVLYALCVYVATRVVLSSGDGMAPASVGGLVATAWWTAHPVHTEAVASIVGRSEILCGIFAFAAVAAVQRAVTVSDVAAAGASVWIGPARAQAAYLAAAVMILCATLSKETGITITVVCAAPDVCLLMHAAWARVGRLEHGRRHAGLPYVQRSAVRVVALAALAIGYIIARRALMGVDTPLGRFEDNPLRFIAPDQRVLTALYLATENARLLVWPWVLSCDYSFDAIPFVKTTNDPRLYSAVLPLFAGLLGMSVFAVWRVVAHRDPKVVVALSWVVFPLLPSSHIVDLGLVLAERTLFLPSVGVALLLKLSIDRIATATASVEGVGSAASTSGSRASALSGPNQLRRRATMTILGVLALLGGGALSSAFCYRTVVRNRDWSNNTMLFRAGHEAYPNSVKMLYSRGSGEANGEHAQALYKRALEIYPFHCYCLSSMTAYMSHPYYKDVDAAVAHARQAGVPAACYYRRGKAYFNQIMDQNLVPLIEAEATEDAPFQQRCKRLGQLEGLHGLPLWDRGDAEIAGRLQRQRQGLGCK
jgi:hypothetical protein